MLLAGAHETPNGHHRRVHDTQLALAGQEGAAPQQEGYGSGHIDRLRGLSPPHIHTNTHTHTLSSRRRHSSQPSLSPHSHDTIPFYIYIRKP